LHTIVEPDFLDPHDFLDAPKNSILQKVGNWTKFQMGILVVQNEMIYYAYDK
jgi:hypothetical protein